MNAEIGFAQFSPEFGAIDTNLETIGNIADQLGTADLLVFPELAVSGYEFKDRAELKALAEPFGDGPTSLLMKQLASRNKCTYVIGYPEKDGNHLYNSCLMATADGALHNYRKIHLFSRETQLFNPGDGEPEVYETPAGNVGMMICFDWVYPETARILALKGAHIIAHPSNLVLQYCQRAMFARSVENAVYTITTNRYGLEERVGRSLLFTGASQVVSPKGETLVKAPDTGDSVQTVNVDLEIAENKWMTEFNHLFEGRRTRLYQMLGK